jgi:opacity protein-like surface antigen
MKSSLAKRIDITIVAAFLSLASTVVAQPAAGPLGVQGLDQFSITGIRSRAMGGTSVASANDASALFSNPAALAQLSSFEIRAGGLFGTTMRKQTQEWVPMRPVPGLSVLFEGLTGTIKTPDSLGRAGLPLSAWSTLQRQYDNIQPNWDKNSSGAQPLSLVAAMPLTFADMNIAAALGVSQVINLDQYYQNNNSMSPYLGQQRPDPFLITNRNDTLHVKWYQYTRKREGSVYGITPGLSIALLPGLRIGGSATFLTGSSDDNEQRVERGHINIAISNGVGSNFMVDTVYYGQAKVGTSKYSGSLFTFGLHFQQERYSIGVTIRPPMELTRTWDRDVTSIDTTRKPFPVRIDSLTTRRYHESGKDYLNFPLSYSLGIVLRPTDKWTIAFDYELRQLADVELTSTSSSTVSHPWVNTKGAIRLGAEYRASDLLALRGGYREDVQAFSPDGSAIIDEPARGGIYSLGAGIAMGNILIDFAYEYSILKYQDIYQSNVNYNTRERHQFMMEIAYRF